MKIVLLVSDTISNRYLIKVFRENFQIVGIVLQEEPPENLRQKIDRIGSIANIVTHIFLRIATMGWYLAGRGIEKKYFSINGKPCSLPTDTPILKTQNINSAEVRDFIIKLNPDLVAVSGTQLLREPILSLCPSYIKKGIINMHTGFSPYIRGGNATFWALYLGHPQYIGATVHFIDRNIDKGDIILSTRPNNIEVRDTDFTLDVKVRYLGIGLYIKAIKQIEKGINKRVKQWSEGQLFAEKTGYKKTLRLICELQKKLKKDKILKKYLDNKEQHDKEVVTVD